MVVAGDFKNGITFDMDGAVFQVVEFQHVKPGKGAAFVRTKVKNVITGSVVEKSYNPTAKFPTAFVERKDMEYSYNDGDLYYFMDPETFELVPVNKSELGEGFKFVKWTLNGVDISTSESFTNNVEGDKEYVAVFADTKVFDVYNLRFYRESVYGTL